MGRLYPLARLLYCVLLLGKIRTCRVVSCSYSIPNCRLTCFTVYFLPLIPLADCTMTHTSLYKVAYSVYLPCSYSNSIRRLYTVQLAPCWQVLLQDCMIALYCFPRVILMHLQFCQ